MNLAVLKFLAIAVSVPLWFCISCEEEPELRTRPLEGGEDLPGYLDETNQDVDAGQSVTIQVGSNSIVLKENSTNADTTV